MTGNFQAPEEPGNAAVSSECPQNAAFFTLFLLFLKAFRNGGCLEIFFFLSSCSMFIPHHQELSDVFIFGCVIFYEVAFTPLKGKSWTSEEFRFLSPILPPDLCSHHLHICIIPFLHAFPKNSHLFANFNSSVAL